MRVCVALVVSGVVGLHLCADAARASVATEAKAPEAAVEERLHLLTGGAAAAERIRSTHERRLQSISSLFERMKRTEEAPAAADVAAGTGAELCVAPEPVRQAPVASPAPFVVPVATSEPAARRCHVVQPKETLAAIARLYYGNAGGWHLLAQANGLDGRSALKVGQRLLVPVPGVAAPATASVAALTPPPLPASPAPLAAAAPTPTPYALPKRKSRGSEQPLDYQNFEWKVYHVRPGDTLASVARQFYGKLEKLDLLAQANRLEPGDALRAGSAVVVPVPKRATISERCLLASQGVFR